MNERKWKTDEKKEYVKPEIVKEYKEEKKAKMERMINTGEERKNMELNEEWKSAEE